MADLWKQTSENLYMREEDGRPEAILYAVQVKPETVGERPLMGAWYLVLPDTEEPLEVAPPSPLLDDGEPVAPLEAAEELVRSRFEL